MQPEFQNSNFETVPLPPAQQTKARCYGVIEIGRVDTTFPGKEPTRNKQLMFLWELPMLTAVFNKEIGAQPFMVMKEVKYSTDDRSNLSKIVTAWRNKPFTPEEKKAYDASECLGQVALLGFIVEPKGKYKGTALTEINNENSKLSLNTISPLPQEMAQGMPGPVNPQILWDWSTMMTPADFNLELWKRIPKFIRDKMMTSDEFIQRNMASAIPVEGQGQPAQASQPVQNEAFGGQTTQAPPQQSVQQETPQQPPATPPQDSGFGGF